MSAVHDLEAQPHEPPRPESAPRRSLHPLEVAALVIVVLAGLKAAASLVNPILLAALLALICVPPMRWLQRHRVPELLSIVLTVLGALLLISAVTAVIGSSVSQFNDNQGIYEAKLEAYIQDVFDFLERFKLGSSEEPKPQSVSELVDRIESGKILSLVGETMSSLVSVLSNMFVIGLLVVFMLFEASGLSRKLRSAHGGETADLSQYRRVMRNISDYVAVKTFVSLLTGLIVGTAMWALGVKFAVLWGVIAFAFNYIPNIGSLIAAVPGVLFAWIEAGPGTALVAGLVYLGANFVIGNVIEPRMLGNRLGLSTLVVFLSLLVWAWVLGPVGMLISAPLTAILKIVLENSRDLRPIAVLLGPVDEMLPPSEQAEPPQESEQG